MKETLPFYRTTAGRLSMMILCFVAAWLSLIDQSSTVQGQTVSTTLNRRVNQAIDDVEERLSDGAMYIDSSDLELGDDPATLGDQVVGMRFRNLTIPPGATILNAYIQFETDEVSQPATTVTFYGQNSNNTAPFTTALRNLTSRPKTSAAVTWNNVPAWNTIGQKQQSPNLAAIVQEIVNRSGWAAAILN
jgi:hypothetical protein